MADDPLIPPLVAVTVAEPAPTAVTTPLVLTVATAALSLTQAIERPARTLPLGSRTVATSCLVACDTSEVDVGLTVTDATDAACVTVREAVPLAVPLVAVMVATPGITPVTVPTAKPRPPALSEATVATDVLLLTQVVAGWSSKRPAASRTIAVRTSVSPAAPTEAVVGATDTEAGGPAPTTTSACACIESTVSVTK
jgi:hypothetical protein